MAYKTFSQGTVIDSAWLNDVNAAVYTTLPGKVNANSPVLITPNIGVATATSVNGITFTQSTGTLTIPNGTTATVSGVNTGDQNLSTYAQFSGINTWTGSNTFGGTTTFANTTSNIISTKVMYNTSLLVAGTSGAVVLNNNQASSFGVNVAGAMSISFSTAPPAGVDQTIYIKLVNQGGPFTVTWPTGTKFPGGTAPALTGSGKDLLSAWYDPFDNSWVVGMVWKDYK